MKLRYFFLLIFSLIFVDFGTKYLAETYLTGEPYISLLWDILWLKLSYNSWVAFSLPIHGIPLQIMTFFLVGVIFLYYFRTERLRKSFLLDFAYACILSWALPHLYERVFVGHVVDFLSVKYFAILNFADIFISVWVFFILLYYFQYERSQRL